MRFSLNLEVDRSHGDLLPLSYQYEQSAVIYKILSRGDRDYSSWLHDNGFKLESGKRFKLFCYSRLNPDKYRILPKAGCMNLIGDRAEWTIGFLPERVPSISFRVSLPTNTSRSATRTIGLASM